LVVRAQGDSEEASAALAQLCEAYWHPLYCFLRRGRVSPESAEDLVQAFTLGLLEGRVLTGANRERGRFRAYLLGALKNFQANQRRHAQAQVRGGGQKALSFDFAAGEASYQIEPTHDLTPEKLFERRWALTVIERALEALASEAEARGEGALHRRLQPYLSGEGRAPYAELSQETGQSVESLRARVSRLRKRCRERIRQEVRETLGSPDEVDQEVRHLFEALGS
tara:strand:+ start:922 stop:1596 length:675 start_codon:yes stop_codon:yes gene_type:complete